MPLQIDTIPMFYVRIDVLVTVNEPDGMMSFLEIQRKPIVFHLNNWYGTGSHRGNVLQNESPVTTCKRIPSTHT